MRRLVVVFIGCLLAGPGFSADQDPLHLDVLGTAAAPSFPPQLLVHIQNDAYLPMNLLDAIPQAALVVDGHPEPFRGQYKGAEGVPAQDDWQGCFALDDFPNAPLAGRHVLEFKLPDRTSNRVKVNWWKPSSAPATPKSRLKEVRALAEQLQPGLPRACVDFWFKELDGGFQPADQARYYVSPGVKLMVRYAPVPGGGQVVAGAAKAYLDKHIVD